MKTSAVDLNKAFGSNIGPAHSSYSSKAKGQGKQNPSSNRLIDSSNVSPGTHLKAGVQRK